MSQRIFTGFGWLAANVYGAGDFWLAALADPHPSLSAVGPGVGRTREAALADLAAAVRDRISAGQSAGSRGIDRPV